MLMWRCWKISITTIVLQNIFLLRKILIVGIPKSMVLVIVFKVFMWLLSLINAGPRIIIRLQWFKMVSRKRQDHLLQARWAMEFLCHPLILQWYPRKGKIAVPCLKSKWENIVYFLKHRIMHCLRLGKKSCLCTESIKGNVKPCSGQHFSL